MAFSDYFIHWKILTRVKQTKASKPASKPAKMTKTAAKAPAKSKAKAIKKKPLTDLDDNIDSSFMDIDQDVTVGDDDDSGPSTSKVPASLPKEGKTASENYKKVW